jgi:23S rRNA (uracil1939-C5)-methyltransferase
VDGQVSVKSEAMNDVNAKPEPMNDINREKQSEERINREKQSDERINVEKWVYGGDAMARIEGRVVFVPFVLPGEIVKVRLKDGDMHAELAEIVQPASERVAPPCALFTRCGGCHYQHAPYDFQVARKVDILREQLRRVGKIKWEGEIETISGPALGYRNRGQFHLANGKIGYLAAGSHDLVPVDGECPISSPRLNQALKEMRDRMTDRRFPNFVHSLELFTDETKVQVNILETDRPVAKSFYEWCQSTVALEYATTFGKFRVSPRSFFQVNRFLVDQLVEAAIGDASGQTALDLYAGVGLFAIPLARKFAKVAAVEAGVTAARDLEVNAQNAGLVIQHLQGRVEDHLARMTATPDFIVADPPRAGLGKTVVSHLARLKPPNLTIVSCDPATLARDVAALTDYKIDKLTLIDLFPQTYHLETVARLTRR